MPISGLVLTIPPDADVPQLVRDLSRDPRLDVGTPVDRRLPVAADTSTAAEDRSLWDSLHKRDDIAKVDVVFVSFDEEA